MKLRIHKGLALYFSNLETRAMIESILNNDRPGPLLGISELGSWIDAKIEANAIPLEFYSLMGKLWGSTWGGALQNYTHPLDASPSTLRDELAPNSYSSVTFSDVWAGKRFERLTNLRPVPGRKRNQRTRLRTALLADIAGQIVMTLTIDGQFRMKKLTASGWHWSEVSDSYVFNSGVLLNGQTALELLSLKNAARDIVNSFAEVHLSHPGSSRAVA